MVRVLTDWEIETVLFTPVIDKRFYGSVSETLNNFISLVGKHDKIKLIEAQGLDIWARDFCPFVMQDGTYKQFKFQPSWAPKTYSSKVCHSIRTEIKSDFIDIRLDGGNFTHNGKIGLCTEQLYKDNRNYKGQALRDEICQGLGLEDLITIPSLDGDKTCHIDGMCQFIAEDVLLFDESVLRSLSLPHISGVALALLESVDCGYALDGYLTCVGCYINFLQTKNTFYIPQYGLPEDEDVLKFFEQFKKPIVSVPDMAKIAIHGGSCHCVTSGFM
jgi:agmatine deiminase